MAHGECAYHALGIRLVFIGRFARWRARGCASGALSRGVGVLQRRAGVRKRGALARGNRPAIKRKGVRKRGAFAQGPPFRFPAWVCIGEEGESEGVGRGTPSDLSLLAARAAVLLTQSS